jgi:hypothetical protein
MRKSPTSPGGRLSGSRRSARVTAAPGGTAGPLAPSLAPDRAQRLSEGALVEASVVARVLGVRLLRLEATVVLAPADVTATRSPAPPARTLGRVVAARPAPSRPTGHRLDDAVRSLEEGAKLLAQARRGARGTSRG